jgi:hypothetical protein
MGGVVPLPDEILATLERLNVETLARSKMPTREAIDADLPNS